MKSHNVLTLHSHLQSIYRESFILGVASNHVVVPIFATRRCLLAWPPPSIPLEPLVSISASAPSPSPPVNTQLRAASLWVLDLTLRL